MTTKSISYLFLDVSFNSMLYRHQWGQIPMYTTHTYTVIYYCHLKKLESLQYIQYTVESSHMDTENDNLEKDGKGMSMHFLLNMTVFRV